ncbi:MAG: DUF2157 domain-containing protein [Pseudomonadota bacterium]
MPITDEHLRHAVADGTITQAQADALRALARQTPANDSSPAFDLTHVLYYLGGLVAIGAMTVFLNLAWEQFGGWGIVSMVLLYTGAGLALRRRFERQHLSVPAALAATFVLVLVPLGIYGLQQALGWWPDYSSGAEYRSFYTRTRWMFLYMELSTLAVGAILLWRYRYPLLMLPIAITLWFLSIDIVQFFTDGARVRWALRTQVSFFFGLSLVVFAFLVDVRSRHSRDYALWLYLFGVISLWWGLTLYPELDVYESPLYLLANLVLLLIGTVLARRVFLVFGTLGVCVYLGYLAHDLFKNSWLFPIALTLIGLGIVYAGILWQRKATTVTAHVQSYLPPPVRELLDRRRQ